MYGVIRRFNVTEGNAHRVLNQIRDGYAREVTAQPGFVSYHIIDGGDNTLVSSSLFETKETAEQASHHAAAWVKEHIARMLKIAPVIVVGEVQVRATRAESASQPAAATMPPHGAGPANGTAPRRPMFR